jgi:hypothetical protein
MAQVFQATMAQIAGGLNAPLETRMDGSIPEPNDFKVHLLRKEEGKFGFGVATNGPSLRVISVHEDSNYSIALWNTMNPEHRLQVGHHILEVNGISGDSSLMMDAVKQCRDIELRVRDVRDMEFLHQMLQYQNLTPMDHEALRALDVSTRMKTGITRMKTELMRMYAVRRITTALGWTTKTGITRRNVVQMPKVLAGDVGADECLICFEKYDEGDLVTQLACKHCFCTKCIERWLTQGSRHCPYCRQEVNCDNLPDGKDEASIDR